MQHNFPENQYKIVKDEARPAMYFAQKFENGDWVYVYGTTTFSHRETEKALAIALEKNNG